MLDALRLKYFSLAICSGNELFFPLSIATQFVVDCTSAELAVVGVEFFHCIEDDIIPVVEPMNGLDCSNALSQHVDWKSLVQQCNSTAVSVLAFESKRDSSQYANLTVLSNDELKNLAADTTNQK